VTHNFTGSFAGSDYLRAAALVLERKEFSQSPPKNLWIDNEKHPIDEHWKQLLLSSTSSSWAGWNDDDEPSHQIVIRAKSDAIAFGLPDGFTTVEDALNIATELPFEIGIFGSIFSNEWVRADYERWGVGRSLMEHGWACIFRGAGHDRLVSRRWLDFGPWRVLRRPDDTTVIQFHDLAITDPLEAYEQAKLGHERMGNSPTGGYIGWYLDDLLDGASTRLYNPATRTLERVVPPGDVIAQSEMLCNAALRLHHRLTRPTATPVDHVAYVFIDEGDARAHLHELWLREMECWTYRPDGKKHRLDLDYHPVPSPPDWVQRLDAR
jgi:hypothetical protein